MNRLRKILLGLAVMLTMGLFSSGTVLAAQNVPVESVRTNYVGGFCHVALGQSEEIFARLTPYNATNQNVTWVSDNPSVVTIEPDGLKVTVRGVAVGTANVTVTTQDGGKTATCRVEVKKYARLSSLKLNRTSVTIGLNDNPVLLKETYVKAEEGPIDFHWGFSSKSGAIKYESRSGNMYIIPQKVGKETVVVTDLGHSAQATCDVTVVPGNSSGKDTPVKSIKLNQTKATMSLGERIQLTTIITPSNATDQGVTWSSSNTSVAVVDRNGFVYCVGAGNAKITATTIDGSNKKATCTITGPKQAASVKITGPKEIEYQGTAQLSAEVKPLNAVDKSVTWTIDKGNGEVDANGVVTCTGSGDIKVRATTSNGKKATYTLKGPKAASSVKITGPKEIDYQGTAQLTATVKPDNAVDKTVTWSIDKGNGEVDANGVVTCTGSGDIKVRATSANGKKATYTLKGPKAAASVKITGPKEIDFQGTAQLTATVKPDNAIDKTVTWSIDKGNGEVDANGLVTCTGAGDIKVRATSANGKKATYTLKGPKAAASVKITGEKNIALNGTVQLTATVKPDNAIDKTVTWEIEKGNGEVDANGVVTCTGAGDIKVRATTVTNKKGTFTIKGPKAASSVSVNKSSYKLAVGETAQPVATVKPANAIDLTVTWSSSDPAIATVAPDGTITAIAPGKVTILATAHNGKVGKCTITVN
ncbi:MAG: Ig domain-containing protein [Lachnospiraceae bacterium]|nr:Ig domain-containing protein [Lachnospiraceae bacterium]